MSSHSSQSAISNSTLTAHCLREVPVYISEEGLGGQISSTKPQWEQGEPSMMGEDSMASLRPHRLLPVICHQLLVNKPNILIGSPE